MHVKEKAIRIFEKVSQFLPVCQIYIDGTAYVIEDRLSDIFAVVEKLVSSKVSRSSTNDLIESKIGKSYKDALEFMDTKRDQDILRGLLTNLTSIRFASCLEERKSREGCRRAAMKLEGDLLTFDQLKVTSQTVRSDLTNQQQAR